MAVAQGKRAGARQKQGFRPVLLALAVGVTASFVAWGYLVYAAIDFGTTARAGDDQAWWFLALASVGAIACLFLTLILVSRISRALGLTQAPTAAPPTTPTQTPPATPGGRRAAR